MAPYDTPIPGAAGQGQAALIAKTAYQNALARLNQQRMGALRQYGYTGDIDPTSGVLANMRVDPNNPYGAFQDMQGYAAQDISAAEDDASARGLSGGLANQGISRARRLHGRRSAALGQDIVGRLSGFQDEQNQAKYAMDSALYQAQLDAARNAASEGDFSPANFSDIIYPDPGAVSTAPTAQSGAEPTYQGQAATVLWNGQQMNRNQLLNALVSKGVAPSTWAKSHPDAARRLGISPKTNANNTIIAAARAQRSAPLTKAEQAGARAVQGRRAVV